MEINRRNALKLAAAGAALTGLNATAAATDKPAEDFKIKNGRIKQSVMGWCFKPISVEDLTTACAKMGLHAMEGIPAKHYPMIREAGLEISLVGSHGFKEGPCETKHHAMCEKKLRDAIDTAVKFDSKRVITFSGMWAKGLTLEAGSKNCVELWKKVIPYAEEKGILLCFEHLNSRDDTHPMKGHPGYFADDVDHCVELIKKVDSPNMKLLFDCYHVQIMNGDVIRRLRQYQDVIGHYHTAGNPGRCEIDGHQELNYPPIMQAILDTGYDGFVAQEFIPTWGDKLQSLRHGVRTCDI